MGHTNCARFDNCWKAAELRTRTADLARRRHRTAPAKVLTEAAAADPFGDCQSEDDLATSLRACVDIHAALRDAEATLKERPADKLLIAVHLPMRRAAIELKRNQPGKAIELRKAAAPYERRYPEVVYLRGLAACARARALKPHANFERSLSTRGRAGARAIRLRTLASPARPRNWATRREPGRRTRISSPSGKMRTRTSPTWSKRRRNTRD